MERFLERPSLRFHEFQPEFVFETVNEARHFSIPDIAKRDKISWKFSKYLETENFCLTRRKRPWKPLR